MRKKTMMFSMAVVLIALVFLGLVPEAKATIVVDMTVLGNTATTAQGVIFDNHVGIINVGTGNFDPFLSLSDTNQHGTIFTNDGIEQAYNTSGRIGVSQAPMDANNAADREKDYLLSSVPVVTISSVQYYEFLLDINQSGSASSAQAKLSLNDLHIWLKPSGGSTTIDPLTTFGSSIIDLNSNGLTSATSYTGTGNIQSLLLDASLTPGSGNSYVDLAMYVPKTVLDAANPVTNPYVILYTKFGDPSNANDGFEEWGVRKTTPGQPPSTVPEPASMALMGIGLLGLARRFRRK